MAAHKFKKGIFNQVMEEVNLSRIAASLDGNKNFIWREWNISYGYYPNCWVITNGSIYITCRADKNNKDKALKKAIKIILEKELMVNRHRSSNGRATAL